ncbi:type II toxin-antitoxin system VapC family toxin [Pseudorhodoferax sp.]|uniref:type II toxin-antitoxin system VapC family toxin n=1 Tax=Pseudorhodoferax sp. TaxID=1993553 RepID=UPI002DD671DB|nr:VapC toxin family PIN domain ribonuclease [Pseudorhodoferax sp.]
MPAAAPRNPRRAGPASVTREPSARHLAHAGPVLVDSGPLIALFNASDHWHGPVLNWLQAHPAATLISTWCVATEVCALLARRVHNDAALDFLRWAQRGGLTLAAPTEASLTEVLRVSERFASLPFDLADASIADTAARLKLRHLLSIDADFDVYRDRAGKPLVNLLAR